MDDRRGQVVGADFSAPSAEWLVCVFISYYAGDKEQKAVCVFVFCRHRKLPSGASDPRPWYVLISACAVYSLFISHGSVFLSCLLMAVIGTYRLRQRSLWVTVLIVNLYGGIIYLVDRWLKANYMYLTKKPGGSSLLDVLGPWPWYIASAEAITIASFFILYWLYRIFKK